MKQQLQQKIQLGTRLAGYAMAAGALTTLAGNVSAQVNYSGPQNVTLHTGDFYSLDVDGDGNTDFNFSINSFLMGTSLYYSGVRYAVMMYAGSEYNNSWLVASTSGSRLMVRGIDDAGMINSSATLWSNAAGPAPLGAFGDRYATVSSISMSSIDLNGFFPGQTRYAGIRFRIGTEIHYGWIRVTLNTDVTELILNDWAWEGTADAAIITDAAGPVATLVPDVLPRTNIQEVTVNVTFDEEATGLVIGDFNVVNGVAESLTEITPGLEYQLVVTSGVHGNVQVTLPAGAVEDMYGNLSEEYTTNWFYDDKPPTVELTSAVGEYTNIATQEVSIVFSEAVIGMEIGDLVVTNGSAANLVEVVPNEEYTVEITASGEGLVGVELPPDAVVDYGNNPNAVVTLQWTYDTTPPEVIVAGPGALTSEAMQLVTISFNEEVTGFEIGDIDVTNGSAANLTEITPGVEYSVEITAATDGEVLVDVPAAAASDMAGNDNLAGSASWEYDGTAPEVNLASTASGTTDVPAATVTLTANETILDLTIEDLVVTNGTASDLTEVTPGVEYTVTITADAGGAVSVELPADAVTDEAGNGNALVSVDWTYNDAPPSVVLDAGVVLTNLNTVTVTVTFSEDISGLELTDFSVTNGTASNLVEVTAGLEYTVDVTATGDGEVDVELLADAVQDAGASGNPSATVSWTYDGTAPSATVDAGDGATVNDVTTTVTITFDEAISGLELTDIVVTNGTASNLVEVTAGTEYTVDITAVAEGEVTVEVSAGAVTDEAGNENALASDNYVYQIIDAVDNLVSDGVKMYPNPTDGMLNVEFDRESSIRVITTTGKLVLVRDGILRETLDISNLSQGVYILRVENSRGVSNHTFVIK